MAEGAMLRNARLNAYLPATDVSRARKFYEQKLGFKPKEETAGTEGNILALIE
jgi:hypothetical protein